MKPEDINHIEIRFDSDDVVKNLAMNCVLKEYWHDRVDDERGSNTLVINFDSDDLI